MARYQIAVVGDKDSVLGFKALGLATFPVDSVDQARTTLHTIAKENYGIIYLTETLAASMDSDIARYKDALTPAIILIPGKEGSQGIGMRNIHKRIRHTFSDAYGLRVRSEEGRTQIIVHLPDTRPDPAAQGDTKKK